LKGEIVVENEEVFLFEDIGTEDRFYWDPETREVIVENIHGRRFRVGKAETKSRATHLANWES
jgi:hypothetical protein